MRCVVSLTHQLSCNAFGDPNTFQIRVIYMMSASHSNTVSSAVKKNVIAIRP
jgi:hypothetical protein